MSSTQPCQGYPSIASAVRAYYKAHPQTSVRDVATALGITKEQVGSSASRCVPKRFDPARILPMLLGEGDRHSECRNYRACLAKPAAYDKEAHCPEVCPEYMAVPKDHHMMMAITIPRVSYQVNAQGGRLW
jgi:putative heme degradation protein